MGPLGKLNFCDQFRFYPVGPAQSLHRAVKRIGVRLQLVQQLPNVGQGFVIEAAASLAHVDEPALVIVEPKHNGAEIGTAALGIGVAADHRFKSMGNFDLEPFTGAALLVEGSSFLCEDAFQSLMAGSVQESLAFAGEMF